MLYIRPPISVIFVIQILYFLRKDIGYALRKSIYMRAETRAKASLILIWVYFYYVLPPNETPEASLKRGRSYKRELALLLQV